MRQRLDWRSIAIGAFIGLSVMLLVSTTLREVLAVDAAIANAAGDGMGLVLAVVLIERTGSLSRFKSMGAIVLAALLGGMVAATTSWGLTDVITINAPIAVGIAVAMALTVGVVVARLLDPLPRGRGAVW